MADIEESVITNGDIVDPMITTPAEVLLNPDDPAELWVRFTGGDPNCTAANATLLTETTEAIAVELQVGITQDALARSCVAGVQPASGRDASRVRRREGDQLDAARR